VRLHTHSLRVLHKWIGLVIGLQLLLWTLSGAAMALIDMNEVAGGEIRVQPPARPPAGDVWPKVQAALSRDPVTALSLRPLLGGHVYEVRSAAGVRLFDAQSGRPVPVDAALARAVAVQAYAGGGRVRAVEPLGAPALAVRDHALPIWRVDFADASNSSFYVSGTTGALLERRNDRWRLWDVMWMLHIMDYRDRASFNHPLIISLGFAAVWLAITGMLLLFRTGWRSDFGKARGGTRGG
jgi:hypothetical protein